MKTCQTVSETAPIRHLRIGLLVNPYAGVGGPLALKGSDTLSPELRAHLFAQALANQSPAQLRVMTFFEGLDEFIKADTSAELHWVSVDGPLGGALLAARGIAYEAIDLCIAQPSSAADTQQVARLLHEAGIDLLLFAGGDGTARDVCAALGVHVPVLGLPAGVKMHSGVFAINPRAATEIIAALWRGEWVGLETAEVRDIDEIALSNGRVNARHFGDMRVPVAANQLQQVKCSGLDVEALVVAEIAAEVVDNLLPGQLLALGPGTTVAAVAEALGVANSLLGFDIVRDGELLAADVTANAMLRYAEQEALRVIITPTGGQGSLIGRGNQQLSPQLLRQIGRDALQVIATPAKLAALSGRPLRLDTHDSELDQAWTGLWVITTGYQQAALYAVAG